MGRQKISPKIRNLSKWFTVPEKKSNCEPATYAKMLRYATNYDYILLACGIICSFVNGCISTTSSLAFQGMVNVLTVGQSQFDSGNLDKKALSDGMTLYSWLYFAVGSFTFILSFFGMSALFMLCERQVHQIRKHCLTSILKQDMEWFDRNEVGTLTHKMSSNIEKIKDGASDKPAILLQATGNLISGAVIAFYLNWKLALISIVIVPFIILSLYGSARALRAAIHQELNAYSEAGGIAEEILSGIRTVMAFNAQMFELDRYRHCLKRGRTVGIRKAAITGFFAGVYMLIMFAAMGITFWYGTQLVISGEITPGTVFSVFWAVLIGAMRMGTALPQFSVILGAKVAAGELFEIIDRQPKLDCSSSTGRKIPELNGRIELKNIHFRYPTRPEVKVLNGISLEIEPGQNVALVGHSGCGKSTIISLLMRYYQQESGCITLDGIPLEDLNIEWLRSTIGIVSQEPVLFQTTVAENLKMGKSDLTRQEMEDACKMANAHEFIIKLENGYDTIIGDGGIRLSGGQKQRLAIARALVRQPKILLLDEATSALDTESERIVQDALDQASSGRTTITIAHRLSTVKNADKIIVFESGRIIEHGTHEQLFSNINGFYRQLVLSQQIAGKKELLHESELDDLPGLLRTQASDRMQKSIASVRENANVGIYLDDVEDELKAEGISQASLMDILKFAKPELKLAVAGFILSLLRGISWPMFSVVYGRLFLALSSDDMNQASQDAIAIGMAFFGIGFFGGIATFASGFCLGSVGEKVALRLRTAVYRNLLRQDCTYFDAASHSIGILTSRLSQDAGNVQAAIDQRLAELLQGLTSLVAGIVIAFYFGWNMAPFCILLAIILVIIQTFISNYLKRRGASDAEIAGSASKIVTESIENVRTVQALTRQKEIFENFKIASKLPHRRAIIRGIFQSGSFAVSNAYVSFNFFASYLFGLWLCVNDYSSPFTVFQVIEALNMAALLISASASYFPEYIKARISAGFMFRMINEEPKIDNLSQSGILAPIVGNVEVQNVRFAYPNGLRFMTLNGLDINANLGQTIAIVGPSGCGKSTIIQLIERFYDILGGMIRIDGRDIRQINIRHLRSNIALVGQEPTLFNLSIRENISYGLDYDVSIEKIKSAAKLANIDKFIESLPEQYDTLVGGRGSQLSGGQRQRIAIARAIIREPKILLLDEATAALDGESEKLVQEALDRARYGRTCLVVAHRLSTIQNADLICVLDNGKCIEFGNHQQLLERQGLYHRLVKSQSMN